MKKLLLTCEFEYDDALMHGDEPEHIAWLLNEALGRYLSLYSEEIGDFIGDVKVVDVTAEGIERLRKGHERYETARRMSPQQWQDAWALNLSTGKPFDEIIDHMRPFMFPDECRLPAPESAETSREGHNTESMK